MTISRSEAELRLRPYLLTISDCIYSALTEFDSGHGCQPDWSPRTCASMRHDLMVKHVKSRFDGSDKVRCFMRRGLFHLEIDGLWLRFKKLDRNLRSRSIPTRQALSFLNPYQRQLEFPGMPSPVSRLTAGYILNPLGTGIDGAYITCPNGSEIGWFIELTEPPSQKLIDMDVGQREPERLVRRVRAKGPKTTQLETHGSTGHQSETTAQRRNGHGRQRITRDNSG